MLVALASRTLGDVTGAIGAYRAAISLATQLGRDSTLAIAYDNLGNVLADAGAQDDVLTCYQQALDHERDPGAARHPHEPGERADPARRGAIRIPDLDRRPRRS
jgi:tetratricopeptide (TPR) repeat protein